MEIKSEQDSSNDIDLFFGFPDQIAYFAKVPSQTYSFKKEEMTSIFCNETRNNALQYRFGLVQLGVDYTNFLVPCIPAVDLRIPYLESEFQKTNEALIKVKKEDSNVNFTGFKSGKRSAILKEGNKYIRLKGCGMEEQGFVQSTLENNKVTYSQLRGCQYINTVKRELYISQRVEDMLKKENYIAGNFPLKIWLYDVNFERSLPNYVKNDRKLISKYCGVFETRGEKRAATHLLQGINIILMLLSIVHKNQINHKDFSGLFNENRIPKKSADQEKVDVPFNPLVDYLDMEQFMKEGGIQHALKNNLLFKDVKRENLIDIIKFLDNYQMNDKVNWEEIVKQIQLQTKLDDKQQKQLERQIAIVKNLALKDIIRIIAQIYSKCGTDIGKVVRIFLENEFNWGYYADHEEYVFHNNAHPNNLVVLPDIYDNEQLLAPVDFDMSFFKNEFININVKEPTYGTNDQQLFEMYSIYSIIALEMSLAGLENMENFKYQTFDFNKFDKTTQNICELLTVCMRDALRINYIKEMEKQSMPHKITLKGNSEFYALVKIALIITNNCVA